MAEPTPSSLLSPVQKRIVAAGATALASICLIVTALALFLVLQRFVMLFKSVLLPLAIAAILATLLRPIITACESHTRLSRTQSIALLYLLVLLVLGASTTFLLPIAVVERSQGHRTRLPIRARQASELSLPPNRALRRQ